MSDEPKPSRAAMNLVPLTAERERVIARLQDAVAEDLFDLDELDYRLDLAIRARTSAELLPLVADLPSASPAPAVPTASRPLAATVRAVFSSSTQRGRRLVPRQMSARAVFGSIVIDLREATFEPGTSTLDVKAVFGSVEVFAPPHVRVEVEGSGVFGSFEERGDNSAADASEDAPVLVVRGRAVFGSVEATVGKAKGRRSERLEQRRPPRLERR